MLRCWLRFTESLLRRAILISSFSSIVFFYNLCLVFSCSYFSFFNYRAKNYDFSLKLSFSFSICEMSSLRRAISLFASWLNSGFSSLLLRSKESYFFSFTPSGCLGISFCWYNDFSLRYSSLSRAYFFSRVSFSSITLLVEI